MDSDLNDNRCRNGLEESGQNRDHGIKENSDSPHSDEQTIMAATQEPTVIEHPHLVGEVKSRLVNRISFFSPSLTVIILLGVLSGLFMMHVNRNSDKKLTSYLTEISELETRTIENELELNILKSRLEVLEFEIFESQKYNKEHQQTIKNENTQKVQEPDDRVIFADIENLKRERDELAGKYERDRIELTKKHEVEIADLKTTAKGKDQQMQKLKAQIASLERQMKSNKVELTRKTKQIKLLKEEHEKEVKKLNDGIIDLAVEYLVLNDKNRENRRNMVQSFTLYLKEQGDSELHIWAFYNDEDKIRELVEEDPDVDLNARNKKLKTPLHRASEGSNTTNSLPTIKYFIENGADPFLTDDRNFTFLHELLDGLANHTSPSEFHDLAVFLIEMKLTALFNIPCGIHGSTPFHLAVQELEVEERTLVLLYKNGVNFNALNDMGNPPLVYAAEGKRSPKFMNRLLKFDSDWSWSHVNYNNQSLVYIAAEFCNVVALNLFLTRGGSEMDINAGDKRGNTPLHIAILGKQNVFQTVLFLIQNGADVNILNEDGHSPLAFALSRTDLIDKYNVIELLKNNL